MEWSGCRKGSDSGSELGRLAYCGWMEGRMDGLMHVWIEVRIDFLQSSDLHRSLARLAVVAGWLWCLSSSFRSSNSTDARCYAKLARSFPLLLG